MDVADNESIEEDDPWVNEPRRHPALKATREQSYKTFCFLNLRFGQMR